LRLLSGGAINLPGRDPGIRPARVIRFSSPRRADPPAMTRVGANPCAANAGENRSFQNKRPTRIESPFLTRAQYRTPAKHQVVCAADRVAHDTRADEGKPAPRGEPKVRLATFQTITCLHQGLFREIIIAMPLSETIQFQATPELRRQIEVEAKRLNLSLSAYILYLHERTVGGKDISRFDRHVREVFGKHGELMRRLAK
jgi:hypothetical protein